MKMTGAQIFVECLKREKVDVIFGIPGGALLPIMDALYGAVEKSQLRFILARHEQGAGHMADGYARATGRVGVCMATSGPGATNLVTALATAHMDSVPIVAFTGQVATTLVGNDAFQEADTTGITRSVTKYNYLVKDVKDLARIIREAFHIASSGRPGPVLVDIPTDVQRDECEFVWPEKVDIRSYKPTYRGHPKQIELAAELINKSERPVLYVGGGAIISNCSDEIKKLAEKAEIPLTFTLMGAGIIPTDHELSLGMLGMHGTYYANHAVQNCDLLIAVGARFDDRVAGNIATFAPHAKIIHIDIDPTSISKNVRVDVPIVGDARGILKELLKNVKNAKHSKWLERINTWRKEGPLEYSKDDKLRPQYVVEKIAEITGGHAIITTEVGQNQMWAVQFGKFLEPRTFISSGGLGTMGYGFPAAIGAQVGQPDKVVFDIAGDGSIQMNIQELATAVKNKIPVKIAILNNSYLGMVRQWQQMFYKRRYSETSLEGNPDFVRVAEAYGATGIKVTKKDEVKSAIKKALEIKGLVVLDFHVEQEENVFPMVPSGKALDEIVRGLA